jgi:hypothetical protein
MPSLCKERSTNYFDEVVGYLGENDKGEKFLEDLSIENGRVESFDHNGWEFFTLVRRTEPREGKLQTIYHHPIN